MNQIHKLALILGFFCVRDCLAADYYIEPRFSANQRFDTNIRMIPKPQQDNWISTFSPGVDLGFRRENSELNTKFTWNQIVYDNQTELNIDEQLLSANYWYRAERFTWGLGTSYNNQSNLQTNYFLSEYQPIQLLRKNLTVSPSVSYAIDEKSNLSLAYNFTDLSYEKNPNVRNLYDYTYHQGSVGLNRAFTERDKFNFTLSTSLLDMPAIPASLTSNSQSQISQTETVQIGWDHSFTEQLQASLAFGINYSQTDSSIYSLQGFYIPVTVFDQKSGTLKRAYYNAGNKQLYGQQKYQIDNPTSSVWGQIFNASLQKSFERGSLALTASQQLSPTAQGNQELTLLNILGKYNLSERWSTGIDGQYQLSTFPVASKITSQFGGDRTSYSITPKINWQWTSEISLQLSYTYRQQSLSTYNQVIREGNSAQLQFNYQPQINRQVK